MSFAVRSERFAFESQRMIAANYESKSTFFCRLPTQIPRIESANRMLDSVVELFARDPYFESFLCEGPRCKSFREAKTKPLLSTTESS